MSWREARYPEVQGHMEAETPSGQQKNVTDLLARDGSLRACGAERVMGGSMD